jgi:hypothetical protein
MTEINQRQLRDLSEHRGDACVSIYMPAHPRGQEIRQDPILFKNLLTQAREQLCKLGMAEGEAKNKLSPLRRLQEDESFWRNQSMGLAVFLDEAEPMVYQVDLEIPQTVFVGDRFHVKPLLPLLHQEMTWYVLALSKNDVRLLRCTRDRCDRVKLPDEAPTSFSEAMATDVAEKHLEFHSGTSEHQRGKQDRPAAFHGQGQGSDDAQEKRKIEEYCRMINGPVSKMLRGLRAPLILAATEPLEGIYRQINSYRDMLDTPLTGCFDRVSDADLQRQGWELLSGRLQERLDQSKAQFKQLTGGKRASTDLPAILRAARNAQVDTLFVSYEDHRWGSYDPESGKVEVHQDQHAGDDDLLDLAAAEVLQHGGAIFAVQRDQIPARAPLAATYRFAT